MGNPTLYVIQNLLSTLSCFYQFDRTVASKVCNRLLHPFECLGAIPADRDGKFKDLLKQIGVGVPGLGFYSWLSSQDHARELQAASSAWVTWVRIQWANLASSVLGVRWWSVVGTTTPIFTGVCLRIICRAGAISVSFVTMMA
ncbi:hypothetical protein D3C80_1096660 [compost metagenome]